MTSRARFLTVRALAVFTDGMFAMQTLHHTLIIMMATQQPRMFKEISWNREEQTKCSKNSRMKTKTQIRVRRKRIGKESKFLDFKKRSTKKT